MAFFFRMLCEEFLDFLLAVHAAEEFLHLDLALELHETIKHRFRTRRTTGNKHVDRKDLIHTRNNTI